ncbi:arrestin domain containing protein [Purpureocillium lavendulum]|uniref:Arrestin domain containing protein n=1 Tax=Purpureocillium lavendulum TaxID=1247861 RepID=A0AB34FL85_9HYPO|nr:arrestin domain containing protein [Purpureocillium lavendulum]
MPASSRQDRPQNGSWAISNSGNIFYRTDPSRSRHGLALSSSPPARFPAPLIGPRRSRPHAIHIVTYPPGYVPRELRPRPTKSKTRSLNHRAAKLRRSIIAAATATTTSPVASTGAAANDSSNASAPTTAATAARDQSSSHIVSALRRPGLGKLLSSFSLKRTSTGLSLAAAAPVTPPLSTPLETPRTQSVAGVAPATAAPAGIAPPAYDVRPDPATGASNQSHHSQTQTTRSHHQPHQASVDSTRSASTADSCATTTSDPADAVMAAATIRRDSLSFHRDSLAARREAARPLPYQLASNRNSIMSVRSAKSAVSSLVTEVPKPVASGSGVSCSILLAEPNIFLSGFDHHDSHAQREAQTGTALLRGKLQINVTKNVKIKAVQLKLIGRARTEWPEGIPPLKQDIYEEESLRTQVLTFFNAMNGGWETEYGNQCAYQLKSGSANSSTTNLPATSRPVSLLPSSASQRSGLTAKELKRLSLQSVQSRSFGKGDNGVASPTQAKGFKVFYPGTYDYSFELPIDHHQLETTKLQYGSVRWELHATVDRAGAFKPNLHGMKEVSIVRVPDSMSLETTEPISISRQWEDQLHYDIIISGKSFPIGSKIPIAFKLTPLAKVQVHKIKVFVTESIEYWTNDRRVTRKDPGRKILLLEKVAGKPLDSSWASSDVTTVRGGELSASERREARDVAHRRRLSEAARTHRHPQPLPEPTANLLGDLDLGLESMWGATEIEANVQIPTCEMMAKNKDLRLHPDCSWKNVNVYHWIKIVMRISRLDPEDPSGTKRRHFEISIDSPFTVLNCRATQANTNLPAYAGPTSHPSQFQSACGCPDAPSIATDISPNSSTGTLSAGPDSTNDVLPAPPQAAHLSGSGGGDSSPTRASAQGLGIHSEPRPIHLMRHPSFNPPAFEDDVAPPAIVVQGPAETPPPQYDVVVGTPSVDGLADYFSRLADYGYHDDDSGSDSDESPARILERSGRCDEVRPKCRRCVASGFACAYATPPAAAAAAAARLKGGERSSAAGAGGESGRLVGGDDGSGVKGMGMGVLRLDVELDLDWAGDMPSFSSFPPWSSSPSPSSSYSYPSRRRMRQVVWAPLEPQRCVPVVLPLAFAAPGSWPSSPSSSSSSSLSSASLRSGSGSGSEPQYELQPRDLAALQRFVDRTVWTFGHARHDDDDDDGGVAGEGRNWYSEAALGLGNSNPFLLHIFIAVALLHDMHLAPPTGVRRVAATPQQRQQRSRLAFHWYHGTALFQRQLARAAPSPQKLPSSARDALWVAAALLGAAAYAQVGDDDDDGDSSNNNNGECDETGCCKDARGSRGGGRGGGQAVYSKGHAHQYEYQQQQQRRLHRLVWPLREGSHPSDLDWLKLGHGKTAVWHVADPTRPESAFHRLGEALARDPPPDGRLPIDADALPPLFARVFGLGASPPSSLPVPSSSSSSTTTTSPSAAAAAACPTLTLEATTAPDWSSNPYHVPLSLLAQLLPADASDRNVARFLTFVSQLPAPFCRLLERRDPRALLLLAYWHAKVARRPSWWVRRRSVVEGLAICEYLARRCRGGADPDIVALLEWPRRELVDVQAQDDQAPW